MGEVPLHAGGARDGAVVDRRAALASGMDGGVRAGADHPLRLPHVLPTSSSSLLLSSLELSDKQSL